MQPNIGIDTKNRTAVIKLLQKHLSDTFVLYVKTLNFHWNIVSSDFSELHKFLDDHYHQLAESIDEIAERIRQLGGNAAGSMKEFLAEASLKEHSGKPPAAQKMLELLLADHEATIRALRESAEKCEKHEDMGTNDFLIGLLQEHEKMAWMIRSYLVK